MKTIRLHEAFITPNYFKSLPISLNLSEESLLTDQHITDAIGTATMEIRNKADIVTVRYFGEVHYRAQCDRCLTPIVRTLTFDYTKDVKKVQADEQFDGILLSADESFDYEQEVVTEILISFPTKHLCTDDCKGLCPVCGCNRNEQKCDCVQKELDPRLEVLRNLKW